MPLQNLLIATALDEIADRLEIQDANPFRVRAYRDAARTIGEFQRDLKSMLERGEALPRLPGVGADLAGKIRELALTGRCDLLDHLRSDMPASITELLKVPGLGPKRVRALWHDLGVETPGQVLRAARDGRIEALHGFGPKTQQSIELAVAAQLSKERRIKLAVAAEYADALVNWMQRLPGVDRVVVAGSFRRMRETVGDLDVLATGADGRAIVDRFVGYPEVEQTTARGSTRASVRLRGGLQVDLRVVPADSFGAALLYFTGSKAHNIALRRLGQERGLKINEYGVFKGARRIAGTTEESVYAAVSLPFISPELREDRGEIEAARTGRLPALVELRDLRGDLHVHTDATDGRNSLEEMVEAARALGFEYVAITEHSRRQTMSHGLDPPRLARQAAAIEALNRRLRGIRVLRGIEVDILDDGTLDLPDEALAPLDIVVAAVHSHFNLSRARQTRRILSALDNPQVSVLAHPSGRLIGEREPYDVDMLQVLRKAKATGVHLELNAHPERLDLTDTWCRMCRDEGVRVAIDSDAHRTQEYANLRFGIGQARRGWLGRNDVLNTRTLSDLLPLLRRPRKPR
ncbi:MAG TPA: DNA polymerase/3'-5' exonuclease PolX [Casimicrobiaceae bacterium]|nr:DNA polymerase/3'-5' exonuclease PolX [Casimicrobiaceae bacterium]